MAGVDTSFYNQQPTNKLQTPLEAMKDVMPVALGQQALSHDQFRQVQEQVNASNQLMGSIAANPTLDTVASVAGQLKLMNVPDNIIQQGIQEFTKNGDDPAYIREIALNHIQRHGTVLEQMQAGGMAPPTLTNTGNRLIPTTTQSGLNPQIRPAGGPQIPVEIDPATLTQPRMMRGPGGQPIAAPVGSLYTTTGQVKPQPGAPQGGTAGPVNPSAIPGAYATGNPPGFDEAASGIGVQSAKSANALTEANDTSQVRKAMLGNLEEDMQHFTSGPGADWSRVAKAWVNRNVPLPPTWQFDPKSIASQEAFNKQAYQLAASQFQAIGGTGTDQKFGAAFNMNPNETMSKLGNQGVVRLLKGNEDAIQAKARAWQNWRQTHGPDTYPDFNAQFNANFDPRAFQFKYIPEKERQGYIDRMDPVDRNRFLEDLTYAHQQGWITLPRK